MTKDRHEEIEELAMLVDEDDDQLWDVLDNLYVDAVSPCGEDTVSKIYFLLRNGFTFEGLRNELGLHEAQDPV